MINAPFKTIGMSELQKVYDMMRKPSLVFGMRTTLISSTDEGRIAGRYVVCQVFPLVSVSK